MRYYVYLTLSSIFVVLIILVFWQNHVRHRYENAMELTNIGDTYLQVAARFGEPSKLEKCPKFDATQTYKIDLMTLPLFNVSLNKASYAASFD